MLTFDYASSLQREANKSSAARISERGPPGAVHSFGVFQEIILEKRTGRSSMPAAGGDA